MMLNVVIREIQHGTAAYLDRSGRYARIIHSVQRGDYELALDQLLSFVEGCSA